MQLGRPIIGSELGGIPELINQNGFIFHHGDVDELAKILVSFPDKDSEEFKTFSAASRKIFGERYTAVLHYPTLEKIYEKAINLHR